jgi:phosphoribosylformylglycinamidine synthase
MAANAIDEALRNLIAVGAGIDHCAILDNFCWGNVHDPEILGGLVRCAQGCYDFSKAFGVPFISGKDSLHNTWRTADGKIISIPGTLLISAISVMEDSCKSLTMDFKYPGNLIVLAGETKEEFGGSHFNEVCGIQQGQVPKVHPVQAKKLMTALYKFIHQGSAVSCHDLSEGGLAAALAEMCIAGNRGANVYLDQLPDLNTRTALFSESATRWLVEIHPSQWRIFKKMLGSLPYTFIGKVQRNPILKIYSKDNKEIVKLKVSELKRLWLKFSNQQ